MDAVFYLSGLALLVSTAASVVLIKLEARVASQTSATDDGEAEKSVADGRRGTKEEEAKEKETKQEEEKKREAKGGDGESRRDTREGQAGMF